MAEWRAGTWAALFGSSFLAAATMTVTWIAVSASAARPLPFWPVSIFVALGVVGIAGFLVAIYAPHRLPGRTAVEREDKRRTQKEIELEDKKEGARLMRGLFSPPAPNYDQRSHTEALNRHSEELRLQREAGEALEAIMGGVGVEEARPDVTSDTGVEGGVDAINEEPEAEA